MAGDGPPSSMPTAARPAASRCSRAAGSDRDRSPPMAAPRRLPDASQPGSSRRRASGRLFGIDATRLAGSSQDRGADGLRQDEGEADPPTVSTRNLDGGARVWPRRMPDEAKVIHAPSPPAGRRSHQAGLPIQASTEYAERG